MTLKNLYWWFMNPNGTHFRIWSLLMLWRFVMQLSIWRFMMLCATDDFMNTFITHRVLSWEISGIASSGGDAEGSGTFAVSCPALLVMAFDSWGNQWPFGRQHQLISTAPVAFSVDHSFPEIHRSFSQDMLGPISLINRWWWRRFFVASTTEGSLLWILTLHEEVKHIRIKEFRLGSWMACGCPMWKTIRKREQQQFKKQNESFVV